MRFLSMAVVLLAPAVPQAVAGTTYYVDSKAGDDAAAGTSATKPWKSLEKVSGHDFKPGDAVSFKRGSSWSGTLTLSAKGTAAKPIVVQAYGTGATPKISGGEPACVSISGNYWRVTDVRASSCAWSGFEVAGDGNQLVGVEADHNIAGVWVTPDGRRNVIRDSRLTDNNKMSVDTEGGDDDSGAFGVLLNGDDNLVTGNTISGSYASSHDYKTDGAAVEIFNGDRNRVTRNFSRNNETFTELGAEKGKTAAGNVFAFNVVTSSRSRGSFLVTRGPRHVVGPVKGTVAVHNSVYLTARDTIGWSCHDGCSPSILRLRNNVIVVGGKMGYEDGSGADEAGNVYLGRSKQFKLGPKSVIADPLYVSKSDLHLRPGSPALGHAVSLKASWYGGAASSAPNAGAYQ
ncbi:right-handed parallel beta-helix repeat-containing protein [Nonomuraea sp. NPDC050556]|uniref:right-handed parallel beta-helix repeat-containing protein n=1 Tax=Nonomuraea sp. NPDC050556 TaxID=3364369 RepID=UPI0037A23636